MVFFSSGAGFASNFSYQVDDGQLICRFFLFQCQFPVIVPVGEQYLALFRFLRMEYSQSQGSGADFIALIQR